MIYHSSGDILDSECDAIVCPVNCQPGVLGAGLALQVATRWPEVRRHHTDATRSGLLYPGRTAFSYRDDRPQVILFPTKDHWRDPSQLQWIWDGLHDLVSRLQKRLDPRNRMRPIHSVAIPALGCGLGGLDWDQVRPMIEAASSVTPAVDWTYYSPGQPGWPAGIRVTTGPKRGGVGAFDHAPGEPILVPDRRGGLRQLGVYDG